MERPSHADIQRDLGRMEGKTDAMGTRLDRLEKLIEDGFAEIRKDIGDLKTAESQRKGAFALGHWLIGAVSGVVAFLAAHFLK